MKKQFMGEAIRLAAEGVARGDGGPFGALVVKGDEILGRGWNRVVADTDPTAHAEMIAIRQAAHRLGGVHLAGCVLYTSCEPCPMCLSAAYWAHIDRVCYGATASDAAELGFDDRVILQELKYAPTERRVVMEQLMRRAALAVFASWRQSDLRCRYGFHWLSGPCWMGLAGFFPALRCQLVPLTALPNVLFLCRDKQPPIFRAAASNLLSLRTHRSFLVRCLILDSFFREIVI